MKRHSIKQRLSLPGHSLPSLWLPSFLLSAMVLLGCSTVANAQVLPGASNTVIPPIDTLTRRLPAEPKVRLPRRLDNNKVETSALVKSLPPLESTLNDALLNSVSPLQQVVRIVGSKQQTLLQEELTPEGDLAIAREWVVSASKADVTWLAQSPFAVTKKRYLALLDRWLVTIQVPKIYNTLAKLKAMLPAHMQDNIERNHVFLTQTHQAQTSENTLITSASDEVTPHCKRPSRIGMLDSAIETSHPLLASLEIDEQVFIDPSLPRSLSHGTAVAGVLQYHLAAQSQLINAAVFYARNQVSQGASVYDLVSGLDWLAKQQVSVINMSLTGPHNEVLARAISALAKKGVTMVAAVGNAGPAALPLYPAAYLEVIGVSAVDTNGDIYRWANQGQQVDVSALGVGVNTARINANIGPESGTSIASPVIAGWLAQWRSCQPKIHSPVTDIPPVLKRQLQDKGEPGWDPVFGEGVWLPQNP